VKIEKYEINFYTFKYWLLRGLKEKNTEKRNEIFDFLENDIPHTLAQTFLVVFLLLAIKLLKKPKKEVLKWVNQVK